MPQSYNIFRIDGTPVGTNMKSLDALSEGLYIINGRKVAIKWEKWKLVYISERERARTEFKQIIKWYNSVKSERKPEIIIKIVSGFLRNFAHRFKTYTQYEKELSFRRIGCSSRRHLWR